MLTTSHQNLTRYTFVTQKVTPEKLANFADVQAFCLVACEESAMLDNREFHAPVVTPLVSVVHHLSLQMLYDVLMLSLPTMLCPT